MSSLRRAEQLYKQDALYDTIKQQFSNEFDKYVDETVTLDAQARYNQRKFIFEVASLFFGVGEIKGILNTGKVTSETFQALRKIPPSMVQFLKSATKFSKDAVLKLENATGKLLLDGQHIVTITKQKITIAKGALIESIDDNLKPIGELVTPDGYTLIMSDGRSLNERVLSIVKDAKGKYSVAVAKTSNDITEIFERWLKTLNTKTNPRKNLPDGQFEKHETGDDIQFEAIGGGEKIWADGVQIHSKCIIDAKHNPGNFYTLESYYKKPFLYGDLEDEFRRYSKVIGDNSNPSEVLTIYLSNNNDDSIKLFEHLARKYNIKTRIEIKIWSE